MSEKAFIYCRISQDREELGEGVERQEAECRALAEKLGLSVVEVFVDNNISAHSGRERPAYKRMVNRLSEVEAVIAYAHDRLNRSNRQLLDWIDACARLGVVTHTVTGGGVDLSTPAGVATAVTIGAWAQFESDQKARRIRSKIDQKVARGEWIGGPVPFGWDAKEGELIINEDEAAIIRDYTQRVVRGASLGSLARELQESGRPTGKPRLDGTPRKNPGRWTPERVKELLLRARNAGLIELRSKATGTMEVVGPANAEAIVTETQWRACVRVLTDPKRRITTKTNRPVYLLGGIGHCNCGASLRSASGRSGPIYKCSLPTSERAAAGRHTSRSIAPVDAEVRRAALRVLTHQIGSAEANPADDAEMQSLTEQLAEIEAQEQDILDAVGKSRITSAVLARLGAERERIEQAMADVEERLARPVLHTIHNFPGELILRAAKEWDSWHIDRRRDWVRHTLVVTIRPQITTDPRVFCRKSIEVRLWDGSPLPGLPGEGLKLGGLSFQSLRRGGSIGGPSAD